MFVLCAELSILLKLHNTLSQQFIANLMPYISCSEVPGFIQNCLSTQLIFVQTSFSQPLSLIIVQNSEISSG